MTVTAVTVATDPTPVVVTKVVPLGAAPTTGTTLDSSGLSQQDADMNAILAKNNKFVMQLVRDNVDLKTLPRGELAASMASPPATLDELKANAVLIVHGVVTRLDITPNEVAAEIMVKDSAKGNARPGNTIRITTRELLTPNPDYTGGMLGLFPSYPGLFKGDEAVFLVTNPSSGPEAVSSADTLLIKHGVVVSDRSNPFDVAVRGLSTAKVLAKLKP